MCGRGYPPSIAGEWICEFCTLLNVESKTNCEVCNHPKPYNSKAVSRKPPNRPPISGRSLNQQYKGGADAARITIMPKPPPDHKPKHIEIKAKPKPVNHKNRMESEYNWPKPSIEIKLKPKSYNPKPKGCVQKPMAYDQQPLEHSWKPMNGSQNLFEINLKQRKTIDIDIEMPIKEAVDDLLFTIDPKQPEAENAIRLPLPYSTPSPPSKRKHFSSSKEYHEMLSEPKIDLSKPFEKPLPNHGPKNPPPVPVKIERNCIDIDISLDNDMKYDDVKQPYSRSPYGQQSLSEAIEEKLVSKEPLSVADYGTEELIRKLVQQEMCQLCRKRQGIEISGCKHKVCQSCGREKIESGIKNKKWASQAVTCPLFSCNTVLPQNIFRHFGLGPTMALELERMQQKFNISQTDGLVRCPSNNCGYTFVGEPGNVIKDKIEVGRNCKPLTEIALKHKAKHRFRCPQCNVNFCGKCSASPYHLGDTCESFMNWKDSKKCRFCEATIDPGKIVHEPNWQLPGLDNVCHLAECQERRQQSCGKIHECGHPCIGIRHERECPPCFHPECVPKGGSTHEEFCSICWTEGWSAAPCVQLKCRHVVHYHCLMQKLEKRWPAARIVFRYLSCGECNQPIKNDMLKMTLRPHEKLKAKVERMALAQLKREGFDEDKRLQEKGGKYYNNKALFAMDRLAYYICFKCKKPYYGGMRKCDAQDIDKWNKEHLVCGGCRMGTNKKSCKIHGTEFIVFKCKFCCSRGSWFCWGNTHFCDKCHKRQEGGDYLNRKPMSAHPKCPGIESGNPLDCPLKIKHPPNGTNFCLGCNVCLIS